MTGSRRFFVGVLSMWLAAMSVAAAPASADEKSELKARFKQRDDQLSRVKQQGKLGETGEGYVAAVRDDEPLDAAARQLMDEENADRKRLYELIAREEKIKVTEVASQNAVRNFAIAQPSEFLKAREGPWVRRAEVATLKGQGAIGETWEGYVQAVKPSERDERIKTVLLVENTARRYLYKMQAIENKTTLEQEARVAGTTNLQRARSGEFIKTQDDAWTKK